MKKVRWGLLSTANINRRVIPAMRMSPHGELVAVASRDLAKARQYAREWEIPQAFGSYEEMLTSGAVDAVYISLPNHLHAEWTIKALDAGVHVLCEKPFALTVREVDEMIAASAGSQRVLAEAFMYRHHPQTKMLGEMVRRGDIGELLSVRSVFNFKVASRHNIRLDPDLGGGSLWDVGVYPLSLAQYLMGSAPDWISASQHIGPSGVDESFFGLLRYPNGATAQIMSSLESPYFTRAEIIGTQGHLVLDQPFTGQDDNTVIRHHTQEGELREIPIPDQYLYLGEIEDLQAAILDGNPTYMSLQESLDHIRTVEALYNAAHNHQVVHL
jgi:xylose dehydrogenase (NAD/NADP)